MHHQMMHTGEKPYVCGDWQGLQVEMQPACASKGTEGRSHRCVGTAASRCFRGKKSLIKHQRTHSGQMPCVCRDSSQAFSENRCLIEHHKLDARLELYICRDCGEVFSRTGTSLSIKECRFRSWLVWLCGSSAGL